MSIATSPAIKALVDFLHAADKQAGGRMAGTLNIMPGFPVQDVMLGVPIRLLRAVEAEYVQATAATVVEDWTAGRAQASQNARALGFTGDACQRCGNFAMRQAGTCATCTARGETTGCS